MALWTFTCRACGRTQQQRVEADSRRVRCEFCDESRAVPREARKAADESEANG